MYAAKQAEAQGLFQVYYHHRPAHALRQLSLVMWLLYSAQAWCHQWAAVVMPVWLAVPLVQIIFNVFPFDPNRYVLTLELTADAQSSKNRYHRKKAAQLAALTGKP